HTHIHTHMHTHMSTHTHTHSHTHTHTHAHTLSMHACESILTHICFDFTVTMVVVVIITQCRPHKVLVWNQTKNNPAAQSCSRIAREDRAPEMSACQTG